MTAATAPLALALLALLLVAGVTTAVTRNLLAVTVLFGVYSFGLAILWVLYRAPDVALTEAAVGAGVMTSLFLVVVSRTGATVEGAAFRVPRDPGGLVAGLAVVGVLLVTVPALPAVGDPDAPVFAGDAAGPYYLENAGAFGIDNVVTAVLVVFRGFDTFGEVAVVLAAAVAVLVVLREGPS